MVMKKYILALLCSSLLLLVRAQNLGLTTSLDLSHLSGDGMSQSSQSGYSVGIYSQWKFSDKFSLQPELLFSQKNVKTGDDFYTVYPESARTSFETGILLNYISVPVLMGYQLSKSWSVNIGPQYSYLISNVENLLTSSKQAFKKQDLALVGGLEWQLSSLKVYGRYSYGVMNINNINDVRKWYSRDLELGIGWRLF
jgi:hypothetical protein